MLPNSVAAIVFLIICALPGYVYYQLRQRSSPILTQSVVQELLSIIFVGALIDILTLALLAVPWRLLPYARPDVPALMRSSGTYLSAHVSLMALWSSAALAVAIGLAWLFGTRPGENRLPESVKDRLRKWRRRNVRQPAWYLLFNEHPGKRVVAGCTLDDSSWVSGEVYTYSRIVTEDQDRELTLIAPIEYRAPGDTKVETLQNIGAVSISASRLVLLTVTYVDPPVQIQPTT